MAQIKKIDFQRLIKNREFRDLFISELGWNRYRGHSNLPIIKVDEKEYNIEAIAERNGFQILTCDVDELPTQSLAKKIDTKLRNQAADYICIFSEKGSSKDLWVVPVRTNEKRDLVLVDYEDGKVDFLFSKIEGFAFDFDEETNIVDLRSKVQGAFAVNSEKITKDFYTGFKKEHKAFADFITGIDDHILTKDNKNKQWYTSVMLNRMMFCYFIQKKGFLAFDTNYLRKKLEWVRENEGENRFYNFYKSFLRRLFHDGLNSPTRDMNFIDTFGKIPYLNGGMFEEHQIEKEYPDINIPDEAFIGLFDFFDKWQWHLDTRMTASGKDINPDVLGYIFEQYINDRASMGAYYTKEDITEYISRNCILPYLFEKVKDSTKESYKDFEPDGFVWQTLKNSGDKYIFDAVKKGYKDFDKIPDSIKKGIITLEMKKEYSETPIGELPENHTPLSELRKDWNKSTPELWALPTEIWRETIERLQRCDDILNKIKSGEITSINDFITFNLDIRNFALDLINTGDTKFVKHFYEALQGISILDPTCGSGAFLFAAMNILEPLYEVCLFRMQDFNEKNPNLFKKELQEINGKYRSNIQYFIFKSIILRNLYGVDIMVEATEIAKLRLFLKMVAVVDVDRRAENLGLDPLPDIDFNIRCGNTLVGYATQKQLDEDLAVAKDIMEELANQEFKEKIDEELIKVADADRLFKKIQMEEDENIMAFKRSKYELKSRLSELNDSLNHRLYLASGSSLPYNEWLSSHQPFNWLAEFYQIMNGNGGFDIIIGNPPYVEYNKKDSHSKKAVSDIYQLTNYETINCGNLYAFVIER
ncbi:MAG: Eco57I restriction-modification methylase domain-containing protein, partial [Muribaculaceae bacterium]|nr:Eco57I restriction-modification methylase domain-containing protein [Muribaculaceae bacterium]